MVDEKITERMWEFATDEQKEKAEELVSWCKELEQSVEGFVAEEVLSKMEESLIGDPMVAFKALKGQHSGITEQNLTRKLEEVLRRGESE